VPYQLHCCAQAASEEDELDTTLEELDEDGREEEVDGADEVGVVPEHTLPLIVGISALPPFLFSWKPKLVV